MRARTCVYMNVHVCVYEHMHTYVHTHALMQTHTTHKGDGGRRLLSQHSVSQQPQQQVSQPLARPVDVIRSQSAHKGVVVEGAGRVEGGTLLDQPSQSAKAAPMAVPDAATASLGQNGQNGAQSAGVAEVGGRQVGMEVGGLVYLNQRLLVIEHPVQSKEGFAVFDRLRRTHGVLHVFNLSCHVVYASQDIKGLGKVHNVGCDTLSLQPILRVCHAVGRTLDADPSSVAVLHGDQTNADVAPIVYAALLMLRGGAQTAQEAIRAVTVRLSSDTTPPPLLAHVSAAGLRYLKYVQTLQAANRARPLTPAELPEGRGRVLTKVVVEGYGALAVSIAADPFLVVCSMGARYTSVCVSDASKAGATGGMEFTLEPPVCVRGDAVIELRDNMQKLLSVAFDTDFGFGGGQAHEGTSQVRFASTELDWHASGLIVDSQSPNVAIAVFCDNKNLPSSCVESVSAGVGAGPVQGSEESDGKRADGPPEAGPLARVPARDASPPSRGIRGLISDLFSAPVVKQGQPPETAATSRAAHGVSGDGRDAAWEGRARESATGHEGAPTLSTQDNAKSAKTPRTAGGGKPRDSEAAQPLPAARPEVALRDVSLSVAREEGDAKPEQAKSESPIYMKSPRKCVRMNVPDNAPVLDARKEPLARVPMVGLGITFYKNDGRPGLQVKRIKDTSAGLEPGDRVMSINGHPLQASLSTQNLARHVLGPVGSVALLTVRKAAGGGRELVEVSVERKERDESKEIKGVAMDGSLDRWSEDKERERIWRQRQHTLKRHGSLVAEKLAAWCVSACTYCTQVCV